MRKEIKFSEENPIRVAVLGAGGLGKAAARIIAQKKEIQLCGICDSHGFVFSSAGLETETISQSTTDVVTAYQAAPAMSEVVATAPVMPGNSGSEPMTTTVEAAHCEDGIAEIIKRSSALDAVLVALPNLPNDFIPGVIRRFVRSNCSLVFVDVLKRTRAVDMMLKMDTEVQESASVVMTGCGATPGFLAAAAVLAAQSFIDIEQVKIWWGVGIANWDAYKATIREDIAHMPGYSVEKAKQMTDEEIEALLDQTDGKLVLHEMEHADDVLLERAGVIQSRDQVKVGGVMDTRHAKKPVSTTMTLTGTTYEGRKSSHRFILGDETTMAANVIGPALGYLKRGLWLKKRGIHGVFGSTEFLPMVVRK